MSAVVDTLSPSIYEDLLGHPWSKDRNCFWLAREVFARRGYPLVTSADFLSWEEVDEASPEPGDLVACKIESDRPDHVAIYLGGDRILHTLEGTGCDTTRYEQMRRTGRVWRVARPPRDGAGKIAIREPGEREVVVVLAPRVFSGDSVDREIRYSEWTPGLTIEALLPVAWRDLRPTLIALVNGQAVRPIEWAGHFIQPGSEVLFGVGPEIAAPSFILATTLFSGATIAAAGNFIIFTGLSLLANALLAPSAPQNPQRGDEGSPTFNLAGLRNTGLTGIPIPVVYGEHLVGGNIIEIFLRADDQGRSILHMLLALSHGEIESIGGLTADVDDLEGTAIPEDIKINGNPAGSYRGVTVSARLGSNNQTPIPGFREQVTSVAYDSTLLVGAPFVHETSDPVEGFDVIIGFPLGAYQVSPNGNVGARNPTFEFRWRAKGTTTWLGQVQRVIGGDIRGPFVRQFSVSNLPLDTYELEVERISPAWPETNTDRESKSVITSINEITYDALSHPGIALLGIRAIATDQLSGSAPTITSLVRGKKVWQWDGVDPLSPSFGYQRVWSDRPPDIAMDVLLNPVYGLAKTGAVDLSMISLAEWSEWGTLCDTFVDNGRGGSVARARYSYVHDTVQRGWDVIRAIMLGAWARPMVIGKQITPYLERPEAVSGVITMGNASDFSMDILGRGERRNSVEVAFRNEETDFGEDYAPALDEEAIFDNGEAELKDSISAPGVTRPAQAYRFARFRQLRNNLMRKRYSWKAGLDQIHRLPGDVVRIAHDAIRSGKSGRIRSATSTTFVLKDDVTLEVGETYAIIVLTSGTGADEIQERTVSSPAGDYAAGSTISITAAWDSGDIPTQDDLYALGLTATVTQLVRITSATLQSDMTRQMQGEQYVPEIYNDDPGEVPPSTDPMPDPLLFANAVKDLFVEETGQLNCDGSSHDMLRITWRKAEAWDMADVWYRSWEGDEPSEDIDNWRHAAMVKGTSFILHDALGCGSTVEVSVVPVSPGGASLEPRFGARVKRRIRGRQRPPASPTAVTVRTLEQVAEIRITPGADANAEIAGYEIRAGATWDGAIVLKELASPIDLLPIDWIGDQTIRVRARTTGGVLSPAGEEVTATITGFVPAGQSVQTSKDEGPAWAGTKTALASDGEGGLIATLDATEASYISTDFAIVTEGSTLWVLAEVGMTTPDAYTSEVGGEEYEGASWDEIAHSWDEEWAQSMPWDGPTDPTPGLTPIIEYRTLDDKGATVSAWMPYTPSPVSGEEVQVRVTLKSHAPTKYRPVLLGLLMKQSAPIE